MVSAILVRYRDAALLMETVTPDRHTPGSSAFGVDVQLNMSEDHLK